MLQTRLPLAALALTLLTACDPPVPDSGPVVRGAGFETPAQIAEREAALRRGTPTPSQTIQPPPAAPGTFITEGNAIEPPLTEAERVALETRATLGLPPPSPPAALPSDVIEAVPDPVGPAPLPPGPSTLAPELDRDNPSISREQDFGAVASERSIAADAARVEAAREQFQIVDPGPLQRPGEVGPNIVSYAIDSAQPVGAAGTFRRGFTASQRAAERRCANYRNADAAQEAFLGAGGPQQDRLGLDPDGDGNACGWNPATYRGLVRN
jgi:hypothetical protein